MRLRFLLGPAGSGKTFHCLTGLREALRASAEGSPLVLVAPKQSTYQLERQLLADPALTGYTRLHILSFERLAQFIFARLGKAEPEMLDEEGRLMVLRALLARKRDDLKLFRASAKLTGFAQHLSRTLSELQRHQMTPESLTELAGRVSGVEGLAFKLQDLSALLQDYLQWLQDHGLKDADCLLPEAIKALTQALSLTPSEGKRAEVTGPAAEHGAPALSPSEGERAGVRGLNIEHLWVDGFVTWSAQELELLAALAPHCHAMTLTFCLDRVPAKLSSWLSNWSVARKVFDECKARFAAVPGVELFMETLARNPGASRFGNNPVLGHLERHWAEPVAYPRCEPAREATGQGLALTDALRVAACANPEAEVVLAAREILRHVRAGGRYREATVLVRQLEGYYAPLQRIFARYEIPFFMDRREPVAHHPLVELTRSALRTIARQWTGDDWFAALKTGLVPADEKEIDELENEALARGWTGKAWHKPIRLTNLAGRSEDGASLRQLEKRLESVRQAIVPPFHRLALAIQQSRPAGPQLAEALRQFWAALGAEQRLQGWAAEEVVGGRRPIASSVHATVWEQMNNWLDNLELAFRAEPLPLRDWLPILEAGLMNLTVGVIPPALDQVVIGSIDRSRNPDIKLAIVLGMNDTVFPAAPQASLLLTELDRAELERHSLVLTANMREQLARERHYAYLACTRARQRLVLTYAQQDADGAPLSPSPFLAHVRQLFPTLDCETVQPSDWRQSQHASELIEPVLKILKRGFVIDASGSSAAKGTLKGGLRTLAQQHTLKGGLQACGWEQIADLPAIKAVIEGLRHFYEPQPEERIGPDLAAKLYGPVLKTSVSRLEQFAACPFKFFVHSGLRAEERKLFELDVKEQGTFRHDVLALFHEELRKEGKRWRDISPQEARSRVGKIAQGLMVSYREGLLQASEQTRFMGRMLTESLQDFVETLVDWMGGQYQFDPVEVELPFGEDGADSAWEIELNKEQTAGAGQPLKAERRALALQGRIDRVDLFPDPEKGEGQCVVLDYKSSQKHLDPVLIANGLQLQLLTYLNVLRRWPDPRELFGVSRLVPAGVFYVNLRGKYEREPNRTAALADPKHARKLAYRHTGRFDAKALRQLDARPDAQQGDQFNYRLTKTGQVHGACREPMAGTEFIALLDSLEDNLKRMGRDIFSGLVKVWPYRKGIATACDQCDYRPVCRLDAWSASYRNLKLEEQPDVPNSEP